MPKNKNVFSSLLAWYPWLNVLIFSCVHVKGHKNYKYQKQNVFSSCVNVMTLSVGAYKQIPKTKCVFILCECNAPSEWVILSCVIEYDCLSSHSLWKLFVNILILQKISIKNRKIPKKKNTKKEKIQKKFKCNLVYLSKSQTHGDI